MDVGEFKTNASSMLHGGTLNKVRNFDSVMQRAANTMLSKIDPIDTLRTTALSEAVHDDVYNYSLPSDYKALVDLFPQNKRNIGDTAVRNLAERFDLRSELRRKTVSIEASEGTKIIRINWRTRQPKTLNELDSLTANGTWSAFGTATNVVADTIDYISGGGSIRFDSAVTGDGIDNTTMTALDLTDEDEVGDAFVRFKINNTTDLALLTSCTVIWGNDLATNFWTGVAQTVQADGTAFKVGWNEIKIPWNTATETGTVAPATTDSSRITFATTGAITQIKVDQLTFSIGRNFDIKYYSKFLLKNTSGTWITKTTTDDDTIVLDSDAIQIYLLETLIAGSHQIEGEDSGFDISWAKSELNGNPNSPDPAERIGLYGKYRGEYTSQAKKAIGSYTSPTTARHFRR